MSMNQPPIVDGNRLTVDLAFSVWKGFPTSMDSSDPSFVPLPTVPATLLDDEYLPSIQAIHIVQPLIAYYDKINSLIQYFGFRDALPASFNIDLILLNDQGLVHAFSGPDVPEAKELVTYLRCPERGTTQEFMPDFYDIVAVVTPEDEDGIVYLTNQNPRDPEPTQYRFTQTYLTQQLDQAFARVETIVAQVNARLGGRFFRFLVPEDEWVWPVR